MIFKRQEVAFRPVETMGDPSYKLIAGGIVGEAGSLQPMRQPVLTQVVVGYFTDNRITDS
ncbi:hypothetical protein [Arthrospira platensis]|jgi:hypothetical protein|uniref:Uncharacterized protein n=1 Tax=Limnospira platensis NIES-46 TaxID=1236695 RepID=A0A5M3T426_LIMPL|nr:hypothetical protein [Arthrospira platensis]AMW29850.1 hypothetical protein AP285_19825 [Arthrospira platensis YZ]KDR54224.1 hypothetical protein APPUASWS_029550 [Arthrospira platensis str. Paraca]MBD2671346.1 hypothetical protein [Arthrospira platensis FACHB-439]MBD2712223.1 hypothetical protein [Arthrospira platensis FACHB-835]MDF2212135.1 hypothetical protein [Arthrospira platensis NCB002]MDT9185433.1 hypothetical protein [Limnospira sp. PMC 289.06]MDT9297590.1 hypothetical protein [Ar